MRIGAGVYAKAKPGPLSGLPMARQPLGALAAETFDRLGIPWQLGAAQRRYNAGVTTQVPLAHHLRYGQASHQPPAADRQAGCDL